MKRRKTAGIAVTVIAAITATACTCWWFYKQVIAIALFLVFLAMASMCS